MRVAGIIAECNPFHEGHAHLLRQARTVSGADYVVVVLSGDYVQRGAPAILPWEKRAASVIEAGADLVLALPLFVSCSGADYFARGAISLLNACGVVTDLFFGSECSDLSLLQASAKALRALSAEENSSVLRENLRNGLPFPAARERALAEAGLPVLRGSNDILAVEYLKALYDSGSAIVPHCIPLIPCPSASERRKQMLEGRGETPEEPRFMSREALSQALLHALLAEGGRNASLSKYLDVSEDLALRIERFLPQYRGYGDFCALLKNRSLTYTRISRALLHIVLGITDSDMECMEAQNMCGWIRPLGFQRSCGELLQAIQDRCTAPWLDRLSKAETLLSPDLCGLLDKELRAELLYDILSGESDVKRAVQKPLLCLGLGQRL